MNLNRVILARSVQNRFRQKGIHLSQSQTCSRRFSEPDYQRSKEVGMAAWRRSHCFLPRQLSRRHISFPLAKWEQLLAPPRHLPRTFSFRSRGTGTGPDDGNFASFPKAPAAANAHGILPTSEPVGPTQPPTENRRPGRASLPSDWTIPSMARTREPIRTCPTTRHRSSPSQTKPTSVVSSSALARRTRPRKRTEREGDRR